MTKPRPFLDTSVLFSGLHSRTGPPAAILNLHIAGRLTAVVSRLVIDELVRAVSAKQPRHIPLIPALLVESGLLSDEYIYEGGHISLLNVFLSDAWPQLCPDPAPHLVRRVRPLINAADAPILAAAIESGADCLVTGNTRHFTAEVSEKAGIAILTPTDYLRTLTLE